MPSGGKREGAGRPVEAGEARKGRMIRFADHEWEQIKKLADELGITASEYIRKKTLKK
jgi:hypothetical protein